MNPTAESDQRNVKRKRPMRKEIMAQLVEEAGAAETESHNRNATDAVSANAGVQMAMEDTELPAMQEDRPISGGHSADITYSRRILARREVNQSNAVSLMVPSASQNDYVPQTESPSWNRIYASTMNPTDTRRAPANLQQLHLDDDLFIDNCIEFPSQPPEPPHRQPASPSRTSVDRPEPSSQPYPDPAPVAENSYGGVCDAQRNDRRLEIIPVKPNHFKPHKIGVDLGLDCMGKHWKAGWTTITTVEHAAKEEWFKEFGELVTWKPEHTPEIKRIFFVKCRNKLGEMWHNARRGRSIDGPSWLKPHEIKEGLKHYIGNEKFKEASERNKKNSEGTEGRYIHLEGNKPSYVHYETLKRNLGDTVYYLDFYNKLKRKPDGTYVDQKSAEIADQLLQMETSLKEKYTDQSIPEAVDLEMASQILGVLKRTGLPKVIKSAATLVEGSKFQIEATAYSQSSSVPDSVVSLVREMLKEIRELKATQLEQSKIIAHLAGSRAHDPNSEGGTHSPRGDDHETLDTDH